jgi:hypothetical protein
MLAIEAASVVDGDVIGDNLILTKHDGSQIDAGSVRGPAGPIGPVGQDLVVVSAKPVLDVGLVGQIRAGRQLTAADFTSMGLAVPAGLWNLSDLTDASGNGRNLLNKGAVASGLGINGLANTAMFFSGSVTQALYISDTGAADPFRIKTGSWGGWFKTSKRGINQTIISKRGPSSGYSWEMFLFSNPYPMVASFISINGTAYSISQGVTDVADNRWHFGVCTFDGTLQRVYVDGMLEQATPLSGIIAGSSFPLNIGAENGDASSNAGSQWFGSIDETFVTPDVLSEDQIRNLYCAKLPHTLGVAPSRTSLNVRRRRKGGALVVADFSTQPLRLHNFSAGSLGDEGSNGTALANSGGAVPVSGTDGVKDSAFSFTASLSQSLGSTDAGLPNLLTPRSYGAWVKTSYIAGLEAVVAWAGNVTLLIQMGVLHCWSLSDDMLGPFVADGQWHFIVGTEDNTALDFKRKLYVDGRLVAGSTVMNSLTLLGADRFRIGSTSENTNYWFQGQIDSVFVTGYTMTAGEIAKIYAKGSQTLAPSPKNVGDHVEALTSTDILATFDSLESQHLIDLTVAP